MIAEDVHVAPETVSQLIIVSTVASLPTIFVFIPPLFASVVLHLTYLASLDVYPFPGVVTISVIFPSFTVRLTSTSYSSHSSSFASASSFLVT